MLDLLSRHIQVTIRKNLGVLAKLPLSVNTRWNGTQEVES